MKTELYLSQNARWPKSGQHIMAHYDDTVIVVYQAFRPEIGRFAADNGYFGGPFSLTRMSWIKPNFLWMMYRCGWAQKADQETVLAITLKRSAFDQILASAVHSMFVECVYGTEEAWKQSLATSSVRLQWDPDHHPSGAKQNRRAIQLGLRGETLQQYAREWIAGIEDITDFVTEQHQHVLSKEYSRLLLPIEREYPVPNEIKAHLEIGSK